MANLFGVPLSSLFGTTTNSPTSLTLKALTDAQHQLQGMTRSQLRLMYPSLLAQQQSNVVWTSLARAGQLQNISFGGHLNDPTHWFIEESAERDFSQLPHKTEFGEIVAWRGWQLAEGRLRSINWPVIWPPDEVFEADGDPLTSNCGIYAHKTLDQLRDQEDAAVFGKVELWGEVVEHVNGYRAQFADIVELVEFRDDVSEADQRQLREVYVQH